MHRSFETRDDLWRWLEANHDRETELWVRLYRKGSGQASVDWTDCVVAALAWGWIDGQKKSLDDTSWLQRLSPRRPRSGWSRKNIAQAELLIAEGHMAPPGLRQVEAARADGRWDAAYAGQSEMTIPQDFLEALEDRPAAKAFFATLPRSQLFPIYYRLHTAKTAPTRAKRMQAILDQLDRGERFN